MSSAGHVADMIARIKFNKEQRGQRKELAKKYRDASLRNAARHNDLSNLRKKKMSVSKRREFVSRLQKDKRENLILYLVFILVVGVGVMFLFYNFFIG